MPDQRARPHHGLHVRQGHDFRASVSSMLYSASTCSASWGWSAAAWCNRLSSISCRIISANTIRQMRAAHGESTALSRPQGATMPPVRTFESRNSRSGPRSLTTVSDAGGRVHGRRVADSGGQRHVHARPVRSLRSPGPASRGGQRWPRPSHRAPGTAHLRG